MQEPSRNYDSVYEELGVPPAINAIGEQTRISGTLMRPEAAEAMQRASQEYVSMEDLQAKASERISELTGAEAGYVTAGAAAGLALSAAACMAGRDYGIMNRLPDTEGIANEVLIHRSHRTRYDVGIRVSGARLKGFGLNDLSSKFLEDYKSWEFDNAIDEDSVAAVYTAKPYNKLPLEDFVSVAHDHDIPVIVDAAAELPPVENFTKFVDAGADIVLFSGGKAIRGPQTTGIVAGRKDLIESIALQHLPCGTHESLWDPPEEIFTGADLPGVPRPGIGRTMKVGKEEIVGLLRAIDLFIEVDQDEVIEDWNQISSYIASEVEGIGGLEVECQESRSVNVVVVRPNDRRQNSVREIVLELRERNPKVFVDGRFCEDGYFVINPRCLSREDAEYLVESLVDVVV